MIVVNNAYPLECVPRALGVLHLLQHVVVVMTWMLSISADRDQAETLTVDMAQDVLEESGQLRGQGGLP